MSEYQNDSILENEIAELNREIESKRAELETKRGIVSERGVLHEVMAEKLERSPADAAALRQELQASMTSGNQSNQTSAVGYLNALSDDQVTTINNLVSLIPTKGISHAVVEAKKLNPFLLDAFHDALVDKLYQELADRGLVGSVKAGA